MIKKLTLVLSLLFCIYACDTDDEGDGDFSTPDPTEYEYTQEEIDAEIAWIKTYIEENDIPAVATESGLHYVIEEQGDGLIPDENDATIYHYEIKNLTTGEDWWVSDREENPYGEILTVGTHPGAEEILLQVGEGTTVLMIVPSYLAFGKEGSYAGVIPPESIMQYRIELNIVVRY